MTESSEKMVQTKRVQKTTYMLHSSTNGEQPLQESASSLKKNIFWSFFDSFSVCNVKKIVSKKVSPNNFSFINP